MTLSTYADSQEIEPASKPIYVIQVTAYGAACVCRLAKPQSLSLLGGIVSLPCQRVRRVGEMPYAWLATSESRISFDPGRASSKPPGLSP
jgi:hypothetical protein